MVCLKHSNFEFGEEFIQNSWREERMFKIGRFKWFDLRKQNFRHWKFRENYHTTWIQRKIVWNAYNRRKHLNEKKVKNVLNWNWKAFKMSDFTEKGFLTSLNQDECSKQSEKSLKAVKTREIMFKQRTKTAQKEHQNVQCCLTRLEQ